MGSLRDFLIDVGRNAYGLGENVASLGSAAIAEPVAGYAAMFDPINGAQAIREGMTYQPRTEAGRMYQQGAAQAIGKAVKPVMPVIDTWQKGVDIAGRYSPTLGALMQTAPTALGVALGAKPTLQAGRQASNTLGAMQQRMIANANAPRTLNTGFMGQRGSVGTQRPLTEFEQAHLIAQQNAALPVSQGGLGLAPDNTAMDRARALGFDVDNPVYHGTGANFDAFDPNLLKETSQYMKGIFTTDKPDIASNYGDTVYPLVQKQGYTLKDKRLDKSRGITPKQIDTIRDKEKSIFVTNNPQNIRSRFAAFDPMKKESSNLLATSAAIAPTATMAAYLYNQERNKGGKQ